MTPTALALIGLIVAAICLLSVVFGRKRPIIIRDHSEGRRPEVWNAAASRPSRQRQISTSHQAQPALSGLGRPRSRPRPWETAHPPAPRRRADGMDARWYDITPVVVILLFFLWPVGLYGLLMSRTVSRGWKVAVTADYGTLLLGGFAIMTMLTADRIPGITDGL